MKAEPAQLKFLRRLVTTLTAAMIFGLLTIVGLLVIRVLPLGGVALPDQITLPDGAKATAFTRGPDWYAIVTENNEILVFDATTGVLKQRILITD